MKLTEKQEKALECLKLKGMVNVWDIAKALVDDTKEARNVMRQLMEMGLVRKRLEHGVMNGQGKTHMGKMNVYTLVRDGDSVKEKPKRKKKVRRSNAPNR
jgi:predicted transcriptional regulator